MKRELGLWALVNPTEVVLVYLKSLGGATSTRRTTGTPARLAIRSRTGALLLFAWDVKPSRFRQGLWGSGRIGGAWGLRTDLLLPAPANVLSSRDLRSATREHTKPTFKQRASRLTRRIREEVASKCLGGVPIAEQRPYLVANVSAPVVRRSSDIINNLRTAIDDGNVLEVMARDEVIFPASVKRFQLGGDGQSRRDHPYGVSADKHQFVEDRCK